MATTSTQSKSASKKRRPAAARSAPGGANGTAPVRAPVKLDGETRTRFYRQMYLIRRFEEKAAEMYAHGKIGGFLHLYIGEEAVAVGAINALEERDHIVTHYRDHGYPLVRGTEPKRIMAELFGRETGTSLGRGGSMHICDVKRNFWGGYAIVGGHIPPATGLAWASKYLKQDRVVLCIFGDGATNEGEFHEAANLASVWKLPIIFLIENNLYGMGTAIPYVSAVTEMYKKACAYDIPAEQVDGMDPLAVYGTVKHALDHCRAGKGPYLLEALTFRYRGHSMADPEQYREKQEVEEWRPRDPIPTFREDLIAAKVATEAALKAIESEVEQCVNEAVEFAEASAEPELSTLFDHLYAPSSIEQFGGRIPEAEGYAEIYAVPDANPGGGNNPSGTRG
ncbi:MAG: pyruvate dehydrogenase (acetyl-transferring) E1 component subunit alpha [Chloroflexia bacterium]|jgi:pyruvate dehydrogenase E1 component alpha subunit|nr:pyruvate dehydrogenase (acetyl-transferring) E1 component subunit alpha [Chloroflexia bacterium]MDQ3045477.1 pyruvate dehydrogenase (acetyl-transferring) E1 component subunit alpha [Chloroflexota bacterium]